MDPDPKGCPITPSQGVFGLVKVGKISSNEFLNRLFGSQYLSEICHINLGRTRSNFQKFC